MSIIENVFEIVKETALRLRYSVFGDLPEREYGNCLGAKEDFYQEYTISI